MCNKGGWALNDAAFDVGWMAKAIGAAEHARLVSPPNPWVGAVIVTEAGEVFEGWTSAPGGDHAEIVALSQAGSKAQGATMYVTLEPCSHQGRTPPCALAIAQAGISRVVLGITDPDPHVSGRGLALLEKSGIEVTTGLMELEVRDQLAPYLKHRSTGRPWTVLKLAVTMDGRIAAPDGSSQWITGQQARADVQLLRLQSDAIAVGAGTIRTDDPRLTARPEESASQPQSARAPIRVVFGKVPPEAKVSPALELTGPLDQALEKLAQMGVLQLLVEGGAHLAHDLQAAGLIDRYVLYMAPAFMGGSDGLGMFEGPGAASLAQAWRGSIVSVQRLGDDLRIELAPNKVQGSR